MRTFIAVQQKKVFNSGWSGCVKWAQEQLQDNPAPIQILLARGGEKTARVVAEIAPEGLRMIGQGRTVEIKGLRLYG